jgi:hypothetical protein
MLNQRGTARPDTAVGPDQRRVMDSETNVIDLVG